MAELNFGRMLRRTRLFEHEPALLDLGNGHESSYGEHLTRIERHCAVLAALGVGPGDRVGVLAEASHVYVELWRAMLAGAAIINPLNARLAPNELAYILEDSETCVVYADAAGAHAIARIRDRLPQLRTVVLIGEGDAPHDVRLDDLFRDATDAGLPPEPEETAPAVLLYTGGTTGLPKGVVHTQRSIASSVYRYLVDARIGPGASYLSYMPLFHIGSMATWAFVVPVGSRVVMVPAFDPGRVLAAMRDHRITIVSGVPTMFAMMLDHPDFEPATFEALELIAYGASPMPPELLKRLMDVAPGVKFWQGYGMTECGVATCLSPEDHGVVSDRLRSVGRAAIGVEIDIRDPETGAPVPTGEVGEIWLRCDGLMKEYWRKPDETRAALCDGFYLTGDAGRLDDEHYLFLEDRIKDMIVTGGENVYSLEVENAIASHHAVNQVGVIGVPDAKWGEAVHAVVVCDPQAVTAAELEAHAREWIAAYKVPKSWTLQAEPLPLSAAGKVLKRELRERLESQEPQPR